MDGPYSIAIETSSRAGGVALGAGERLVEAIRFDASRRHASQLVLQLDKLLRAQDLRPKDLEEVYVSGGPGSFTGTRIAVTVARTLAQALDGLRIVLVPTAAVVARQAQGVDWQHLAVLLAAKRGRFHATLFEKGAEPSGDVLGMCDVGELLEATARPLHVTGEAVDYIEFPDTADLVVLPAGMRQADPAGLWKVGREMAREGRFTPPNMVLPIYPRKPEAVRLWEMRREGPSNQARGGS